MNRKGDKSLIVGLDIGTSKVVALVGEYSAGNPIEVIGKALIAPLVGELLRGIRTGTTPSPSFADGLRAQSVLDSVLESSRRGTWVAVDA